VLLLLMMMLIMITMMMLLWDLDPVFTGLFFLVAAGSEKKSQFSRVYKISLRNSGGQQIFIFKKKPKNCCRHQGKKIYHHQ